MTIHAFVVIVCIVNMSGKQSIVFLHLLSYLGIDASERMRTPGEADVCSKLSVVAG
jgi:hypothetical protein